ncbi:hypothetical protein [Rhizorhapis sp.]|uniref:hypothetical protein n=1 Tax=Rhizorhapis sp. TaxID=1968842 RepID=UPI002B45B49B|nr:hypothetical protein [Rhizorhapis sp.]HKR16998.1 hypothetical protein [Rhizorhapis sp.]
MFERLMALGLRRAEVRKGLRIAVLAERLGEDLPPGVRVEAGEDSVVLSGRRLWPRWLSDARLRAIGLLARGEGG